MSHLAGIIPVANLKTNYGIETPPYLLPVEASFTCIQKSVFECAMAGCDTIWIVGNQDTAPIIRKIVGEWTFDPVYYNRPMCFANENRHEIPIYYTGIYDKDRDRRDSYGWSVFQGIHSAWWVSYKISKWSIPQKYFISFPMGMSDVNLVRKHRAVIVKDNLPLSFTMRAEDFIQCRRHVNKLTTREFLPPDEGEKYPSKRRPLSERWSARWFDFSIVFEKTKEEDSSKINFDWFYDLSDWQGYRDYLGSPHAFEVPGKHLTKPHKHGMLYKEAKE
jgi:hypothetical protein